MMGALKDYEVECRDWSGVDYVTVLADSHNDACKMARQYYRDNGRMRHDGPLTVKPRVKRSIYDY